MYLRRNERGYFSGLADQLSYPRTQAQHVALQPVNYWLVGYCRLAKYEQYSQQQATYSERLLTELVNTLRGALPGSRSPVLTRSVEQLLASRRRRQYLQN